MVPQKVAFLAVRTDRFFDSANRFWMKSELLLVDASLH